ncbi:MAG TPA: acyl-CoA dehydrogenase family protein [Streptosporangiaceae bacterium]|nr:acyl-CoA dehydrogenase family protein [Streptosporangiaceae bacterium]
MSAPDELAVFAQRARAFLDENATRRVTQDTAWGEGPDRVPLLEQSDPEAERRELTEARAWRQRVFDAGFGWLGGPAAYGGGGRTPEFDEVFRRIENDYEVPGRGFFGIARNMLAPAILRHGTEELKHTFLRPLFRGDLVACQLFSEPGAGSDLAGVRTAARREGDGWRVSGQKVWTSYAHLSQVGELLARTDPSAPKHHGLTMFVLDMEQPGVDVRPLRQMNGGAHFNEVFLTDVYVPDAHRIGAPGTGWHVARTTLTSERGAVGSGESTLTADYVDRLDALLRHVGGTAEPRHRDALAAAYVAGRILALVNEQAGLQDNPGPLGSVVKLLFSRQLERVANTAADFLGDRILADTGEWGTFAWSDFLLSAPGLRIAGGTDEIMLNILGESVLGLPREPRPREDR